MLYLAFLAISIGFGLATAAVGSAYGLSRATAAAMEGTARQPEAAADIRLTFIIGAALMEALTLYALLAAILLWVRMPGAAQVLEILGHG
ncbi:MAG: ATP synthase F0 subunit C [Candidatus Hydrogenedentota bacterium]|nr:MAG: ATP synthase F0 subunit C [Candidatus Hydrogenedentota bacterium]